MYNKLIISLRAVTSSPGLDLREYRLEKSEKRKMTLLRSIKPRQHHAMKANKAKVRGREKEIVVVSINIKMKLVQRIMIISHAEKAKRRYQYE